MKKLLNDYDHKAVIHVGGADKLIQEGYAFGDKAFYEGKNFSRIINYSSINKTPLYIQPSDYLFNRILKRAADIFLATIVIFFILSWLTPVMAILIKLDSKGPVFFLQKRNKRYGKVFTCIKFRTMIINNEADTKPARINDRRITKLGRFLRNNHLDEFPQFINVLSGDMSVIGPRPHMISENLKYDELIQQYSFRCKVKPGITGLAQVMGYTGSITDIGKIKNRVNMDNFYIRHWSLKLDVLILYKTIFKTIGSSLN